MVAKKKPSVTKTLNPTDVKAVAPAKPKRNTPPKKIIKKAPKKAKKKRVAKPKPPIITEQDFANYFFKLPYKKFVQLTSDWNDENLKIKLQRQETYDAWLNYFKTLSPNQIKLLANTGLDILPTEGYAALSRWHDIISNPGRIDKIHKAGLTTGNQDLTIVDYAKKNDRLGVLEAIRMMLAEKIQQGTGARDAGPLSAQMMEVMTQIDIQTRKLSPKKETALGALMGDMPTVGKRPSENGKGARHTSFASRVPVTLEDLEANQ